ncbi:interferon-inducible GTPase 1-like [Mercenaria mercenaria]|uniref:interferon-inducible GTPase 1-like n=1 Tax=Mercenaria mercenaria TaxID=6596 RepID=UPI00234EAD69|nr:interferon-inducible GTPase 1-like [Mercenaria mercenaria]
MVGLQKELREKSENWEKVPINIAVIGELKTGKSSFINAVLGLTADDEGSAEVGVTHKTTEPKAYAHPRYPNFILTDMPGVGTPFFKKGEYLEGTSFWKYDYYLLLSAKTFTENDRWLVQQIQKRNGRFYIIRTHVENDIRNDEIHIRRHIKLKQ